MNNDRVEFWVGAQDSEGSDASARGLAQADGDTESRMRLDVDEPARGIGRQRYVGDQCVFPATCDKLCSSIALNMHQSDALPMCMQSFGDDAPPCAGSRGPCFTGRTAHGTGGRALPASYFTAANVACMLKPLALCRMQNAGNAEWDFDWDVEREVPHVFPVRH